MVFYDTHVHFDLPPLELRADIEHAFAEGVERIIAVGGAPGLNENAAAAAALWPQRIVPALGYDRDQAALSQPETLMAALCSLADTTKLAAIGETGLDFHYHPETAAAQCALFSAHLLLADEWRLPVIIHSREADAAILRVLDETPWHGSGVRGVVHSFTGDRHFARQLLDRGLAISFSGIVTFRNADMLRETAAMVPDDRLLIETDTPFLAPVPQRGKRNRPSFVIHVAESLARVRNKSLEYIAEITTRNALRIFG